MQRSIFKRYLGITMGIILLSFVLLGSMMLLFFRSYWREEKKDLLTQNAQSISTMATRLFLTQKDSNAYELQTDVLQGFISAFSISIDADIFLTDLEGNVLLGNYANSRLETPEKVPGQAVSQAVKGMYESWGTFGGQYQGSYYTIGVPMNVLDGPCVGAVFAATSAATVDAYQTEAIKIFLIAAVAALGTDSQDLPAVRDALLLREDGLPTAEEARGDCLPPALFRLVRRWDDMSDLADLLNRALVDELPVQVTDGGLFRQGYNAELDELLDLVEHGESRLQALLREEQVACNMPKLKLGFNRVFGYYFELTKAQQTGPVPEHFQRRQTLANAERFTTERLKELEERLLSAAESRKSLEYKLYQELRLQLAEARPRLLFMADMLAQIDYWQSLAEVAARQNWCRPTLHEGPEISIREGRHPVVEAVIGRASFIPNDLHMDPERRLVLITGPNMAGKSTVLRQTAILCILAQMGSFVPAAEAKMGLVDRVFSRVGASDNLAQGQSTFMVEMMETARILRQATKRSLVILDEIGRGTSTFDGLALAWAVVEELARRAGGGIRTLFATHYHELTSLDGLIPGVYNMNIGVREWNGDIVFLRRLLPGPADRSYGIEVARLAGVPTPVVQRAREILARLEQSRGKANVVRLEAMSLPGLTKVVPPAPEPRPEAPAPVHPLLLALRDLNPDTLSPMAALKLLSDWKTAWGDPRDKS